MKNEDHAWESWPVYLREPDQERKVLTATRCRRCGAEKKPGRTGACRRRA